MKKPQVKTLTPSGYPSGLLRDSCGLLYQVKPSGQIVRQEPKLSKAERRRQRKERRQIEVRGRNGSHGKQGHVHLGPAPGGAGGGSPGVPGQPPETAREKKTGKKLIQETRDLMARAGINSRIIDRFLAELRQSTPAVVRARCREWQEKLGENSQQQRKIMPVILPEEESNTCEAEVAADCLDCPAERFLECALA